MAVQIVTAVTKGETRQLQQLAAGKTVLECGAEYGYSTIQLAFKADKVFSVDWQGGDPCTGDRRHLQYQATGIWITNLFSESVIHKVVPILGKFEDVLPYLAPASFQMGFLDGDHRYEAVVRDIKLMLPLLTPGATFAFHDYGRDYGEYPDGTKTTTAFGVTEAVDALAQAKGVVVSTVDYLAWITL